MLKRPIKPSMPFLATVAALVVLIALVTAAIVCLRRPAIPSSDVIARNEWQTNRQILSKWDVVVGPPVEGATDIFFVGRGGGFAYSSDALLVWRKGDRTFAARAFRQRPEWPGRTILDVSDSAPVDAALLDNLIASKKTLEQLRDVWTVGADDYVYWIYIKQGTSESRYVTRDRVFDRAPGSPAFYASLDGLWVKVTPSSSPVPLQSQPAQEGAP